MSEHAYQDYEHGYAHSWKRIHGNAEETHVFIMEQTDDYLVLAMDIDPRDWEPVAAEAVAYEPTLEGAVKRSESWMRENPKGIAGGEDGSRIMGALKKIAEKTDDYGSQQVEELQEGQ